MCSKEKPYDVEEAGCERCGRVKATKGNEDEDERSPIHWWEDMWVCSSCIYIIQKEEGGIDGWR